MKLHFIKEKKVGLALSDYFWVGESFTFGYTK